MQKGFEKRFKQGDIVYWCHDGGNMPYHKGILEYSVKYGMVDEQFSDAVVIDYLALRERRRVDGIPINEFQSEQRFRKLPKGWAWNTKLYEITNDPLTQEEIDFPLDITNPETIKEAYNKGFLVKDSTKFHGKIEEEITKDGFRIVKSYPMWEHHITHISIRPDKVYFTYEEAQKEVDDHIAEFQRQINLSDYEWSIEQIDKTLKRYQIISDATDEEVKQYRDWILDMKNVEDIETRIFGGQIQWRYWKNKRWNYIEL